MSVRPLPDLEHPVYGPFWRAAAAGELAVQRCGGCGHLRWPPQPGCPQCLARGGDWTPIDGAGTLWSVAVYEHAFDRALRDELPYACGLVELDAGPRMVARVGGEPLPGPGARVTAAFVPVASGIRLVRFDPVPSGP